MPAASAHPLIFLHLPKTAGTTFNTVLKRQFQADRIHLLKSDDPQGNILRFKSLPEEARHRIQLLRGHQAFGLHPYLAPGARYLTVLRDPVARLVSHYHYVKSTEHPMFVGAIRANDMSLEDYAASGISGELENGQTRWLAGIWDDRLLDRSHLEQALANIDRHFAWVGLTEFFTESLVELGLRMRWHRISYATRNVGEARPHLPPARALEIIRERNRLDLELYRLVLGRFENRNGLYRSLRKSAAWVLGRYSNWNAPESR